MNGCCACIAASTTMHTRWRWWRPSLPRSPRSITTPPTSPTIAAAAYKHALGQPFVYPRNDLDYTANMLHMFFAVPCEPYAVDELHAKALDLLFILHADHEQN